VREIKNLFEKAQELGADVGLISREGFTTEHPYAFSLAYIPILRYK